MFSKWLSHPACYLLTWPPPGENTAEKRSDQSVDALFRALADRHRRSILGYLADQPGKTVECDEVVEYLYQHETADIDYESLELVCHHSHFPRLDQSGLVEHDAEERTLRILQQSKLETVSELADELEE